MIKTYRTQWASAFFAAAFGLLVWNIAQADEGMTEESAQELVQPFYDYLSGEASADEAFVNMAEGWRSYSSDTEYRLQEETAVSVDGLRTHVVPDLNWAIHDVIVNDDFIIIRGEGSGTPIADFLGVTPTGKTFSVMSIDIHEVVDGKIARTWHIEGWAEAIRQLRAN